MASKEEQIDFSNFIEKLALELKCDYLDAILEHCKITSLEIEVAATLISAPLKAKMKEQAEKNNQLKKISRLPI